jgi:hypothetical protein
VAETHFYCLQHIVEESNWIILDVFISLHGIVNDAGDNVRGDATRV